MADGQAQQEEGRLTRSRAAAAVLVLSSLVLLGASPAKTPTVRLSLRSKAGAGVLWVHRPATVQVQLKGSWPPVTNLVWVLDVEGVKRATGTIEVDAPGHPQREFEHTLVITDEDYIAGRTIAPPDWLDTTDRTPDPVKAFKSNRRRLLLTLSIRNGETDELIAKGQADVMIEPVPMNVK